MGRASLSLRATFGILSAATVTVVACVTLSIALTSSIDALRAMGARHADALLVTASNRVEAFFAEPATAIEQLINVTAATPLKLPSEDRESLASLRMLTHALWLRGHQSTSALRIYFRDNTEIVLDSDVPPELAVEGLFDLRIVHASHFSRDFPNGNQTLWEERLGVSFMTHRVERNLTNASALVIGVRSTGIWRSLHVATFNSFAPVVFTPLSTTTLSNSVQSYVPMSAPLYALNAPARSQQYVLGYVLSLTNVDGVSTFLRGLKSTPGTAVFAFDQGGHMLGTSEPAPIKTTHPPNIRVEIGCSATADYADGSLTHLGSFVVCRSHVSAYPHAALNAIASKYPASLFPALRRAEVRRVADLGGESYYAASVRVHMAYRGTQVYLLLLMPEADVIGDVITSRNVAIGVTCGLVALAAAVNAGFAWLLLAPLSGIADRMKRAADFEDDDEDVSVSAMAEVAELQEAYYAMNDELNRIRSYVPQSVLVARKVARGECSTDGSDSDARFGNTVSTAHGSAPRTLAAPAVVTNSDADDTRSNRSRRALSHRRSRKRGADGASVPSAVSTASSADLSPPSTRNVTVLVLNTAGLHAAFSRTPERHSIAVGAAVHAVNTLVGAAEGAVRERNGVLSFHGDRCLATFNAARPCAGHSARAAMAALSVVSTCQLAAVTVTAGLATGRCIVGAMGSSTLRAFCAVGPAVSAAAGLERVVPLHRGVSVLATHRCVAECGAALQFRYVDLVSLPDGIARWRPTAAAALSIHPALDDGAAAAAANSGMDSSVYHCHGGPGASVGSAGDAQWLGMVHPPGEDPVHAQYNDVFEALHMGDVSRAVTLYAAAEVATSAHAAPGQSSYSYNPPPRLVEIMEALRRCEHTLSPLGDADVQQMQLLPELARSVRVAGADAAA